MKELLLKILVKIKKEVIQLNNLDTDKYFENMDSLLLENFWKEDSIKYNFDCTACGNPPYLCSAILLPQ